LSQRKCSGSIAFHGGDPGLNVGHPDELIRFHAAPQRERFLRGAGQHGKFDIRGLRDGVVSRQAFGITGRQIETVLMHRDRGRKCHNLATRGRNVESGGNEVELPSLKSRDHGIPSGRHGLELRDAERLHQLAGDVDHITLGLAGRQDESPWRCGGERDLR
jgi:hypothetical protein